MNEICPEYRFVKSLIRKKKHVESYFLTKYMFSPYAACQHGCIYCDGRAEKYYVQGDFEKNIIVRKSLPQILEKELITLREPGFIHISSGISDPYQPIDKNEKLMKTAANIISRHAYPANVLTKSALIMRDIAEWKKVHKKSAFILMVSLTFIDDNLRQIFEPEASSVSERLELLTAFKNEGMYTGIIAMPFLPYISDSSDQMEKLFTKAKSLNVDFVIPATLTLRPGRQKNLFLKTIQKQFPELISQYNHLYSQNKISGVPLKEYFNTIMLRARSILDKLQIPTQVPHHIYKKHFALYDQIRILIEHFFILFSGTDQTNLKTAYNTYSKWLDNELTDFYKHRNRSYKTIDLKIIDLLSGSNYKFLDNNIKLTNLIKQIVLENKTYNYILKKTE